MQTAAQTKEQLVRAFRTREILDAARRVVAELGVREASVERIARAAGISKGTVYLYFDSREDLLLRTAEVGFAALMEQLSEAVSTDADAPARLRALARASFDHAAAERGLLRALLEPGGLAPEPLSRLTALLAQQNAEFVELVAGLVRSGIERGELRDLPARRAALAFTGSLRAELLDGLADAPEAERRAGADLIVDLWLRGATDRP